MAKVAQRQIVATVVPSSAQPNSSVTPPRWDQAGGRTYFAQVSGGEVQATVEKVYDGGSTTPEALPAPIEVGDLTVTRHYDPASDGPLINAVRPLVGKARYDITVVTLDPDNNPIQGISRIYPRSLLVNVSESEGDSSSGGPATFSMTFSCENIVAG